MNMCFFSVKQMAWQNCEVNFYVQLSGSPSLIMHTLYVCVFSLNLQNCKMQIKSLDEISANGLVFEFFSNV